MKITRLTVSNLLRIKAAEIRPDGSLVIVGGQNDAGKSSLLNSIAIALSGKDLPQQPIRAGQTSGYVVLETEELVVTRKFSASGGGSLEVRDKDGAKIISPQAKLDTLVSRVTFDPFEFTRMDDAKQVATLKSILGLDFTELDNEYRAKYDQRTAVGRSVKEQDARLKAIPRVPTAPAEEVSVEALTAKLRTAQAKNLENDRTRDAASNACDAVDTAKTTLARHTKEMQALRDKLLQMEEQEEKLADALAKIEAMRDEVNAKADSLQDEDTDAILAEIQDSEGINRGVRANREWEAAHKKMMEHQQEVNALTSRLEEINEEKAARLSKAEYPVPGLGFGDSGVTYNGLPFQQAGTAVKIRTSVAIARSLNPKLPVMLIRDGSLLDENSLALLAKEAEEHGLQCWCEVVGSREDATVIIEDGEVIARPAAEKKAKAKSKS